jgi:hypothetical protein
MSKYCELHKSHSPEPLTSEQHHVTPQAWQHFKQTGDHESALNIELACAPGNLVSAGIVPALYDKRTVRVAPTCHRNVHFWIVKIMKSFEAHGVTNSWQEDEEFLLDEAIKHVRSIYHAGGSMFGTAILASSRYLEAGGSLRDLCSERLYGYA